MPGRSARCRRRREREGAHAVSGLSLATSSVGGVIVKAGMGRAMMDFVIDGRCYQDKDYAFRGIGYSTMSLLRHIPDTYRQYIRFIALVSGEYDPIPDSLVDVFDVVTRFPVKSSVDCIFLSLHP